MLVIILVAVGAVMFVVKQKGGGSLLSMTQNLPGGKVLGAQNVQTALGVLQPAAEGVAGAVSNGVSQVADKVLVDHQKVELDQAFSSIQASAAGVPQSVFTEARYAYCKQVVIDHDGHL